MATGVVGLRAIRINLRINKAIIKHRKWKVFKTVNNSRLIWDAHSKPKGLLGGHINIRSILSKCEQVQHLLQESNLDFLAISESWLNENSPHAAISVPSFNIFNNDHKHGKGGGVMCYIKDTIRCNVIKIEHCELEYLCLNIVLSPEMSFTLIVIYRPPSSNVTFYEKFGELLQQCDFNREVIVIGDINVNWEDKSARKQLKQVTDSFNLTQIIDGPTRITNSSSTQIDLLFSNMSDRIIKSYNLITGLSDHNLILIAWKVNGKKCSISDQSMDSMKIPKNKKEDFKNAMQSIKWDDLMKSDNLEYTSQYLTDKLHKLIKEFSKKSRNKNKRASLPWINDTLFQMVKERDQALKISVKSKLITDRHKFTSLRNKRT